MALPWMGYYLVLGLRTRGPNYVVAHGRHLQQRGLAVVGGGCRRGCDLTPGQCLCDEGCRCMAVHGDPWDAVAVATSMNVGRRACVILRGPQWQCHGNAINPPSIMAMRPSIPGDVLGSTPRLVSGLD